MSGEDLRAILGLREESFAAEWAAHRLDEVSERRVLGRVRRARGVRWGVSAGAAAVAAAAVGVGVWALAGAQQREPLVTPPSATAVTSSASPTPTPSATPSPTPEMVFDEPLPADEFFLEAEQLIEDVWKAADDGWSLTYWQPSRQAWGEAGHDVTDPGVAAIYLMDDRGNRYEVSHFDVPAGAYIALLAWEPTDFTAIVLSDAQGRQDGGVSDPHVAVLDLRTGDITESDVIPDNLWFMGVNADSHLLFQTGYRGDDVTVLDRSLTLVSTFQGLGHARLSPDGTTLVAVTRDYWEEPVSFEAFSATSGELVWTQASAPADPNSRCEVSGWATPSNPALVCTETAPESDDTGGYTVAATTFYSIGESGVVPVGERDEDLSWSSVYPLDVGLVACGAETFEGNDACSYYLLDGASLVSPGAPADRSIVGAAFVVSADIVALHEWAYTDAGSVAASNTALGTSFEITPRQGDDPTWWWTTSASVVFVGTMGPTAF